MGICPEDKNSIDRKNNNGNYGKRKLPLGNSLTKQKSKFKSCNFFSMFSF